MSRRDARVHVFDTINHFFLVTQMIVPGLLYWNFAYGTLPGEAANDAEGMANMRDPGHKIAWLAETLAPVMNSFPKANPTIEDIK